MQVESCATRKLCIEDCEFPAMIGKNLCHYHEELRIQRALKKVNEEPRFIRLTLRFKQLNWPFISVMAGVLTFWVIVALWVFSR